MTLAVERFQAFTPQHFVLIGIFLTGAVVLTLVGRSQRRSGTGHRFARVLAVVVVCVTVPAQLYQLAPWDFSVGSSLPLALCDVGVIVAASACWWRVPLLVELTYFWGLAGTLQAVITPDLQVGFPHLMFFEYLVGHLGIVLAAVFLVVGRRLTPRPSAVPRVFAITAVYTAFVGFVDAVTGANYMSCVIRLASGTCYGCSGPGPGMS